MGSLGRLEVQPPQDMEAGDAQLSVFAEALQVVTNRVGVLPGIPHNGFRGEMPSDITTITDEALGNLLNNLSQWCGYLEVEYAKALGELDESKAREDFIRSRVRIDLKLDPESGKKYTVQDKNDLVETHPQVVLKVARRVYCEHVYALTRVLRDKAQRDWETASRRITQRGQGIDRGRRENNVGGSAPAAPVPGRAFRRVNQQAGFVPPQNPPA